MKGSAAAALALAALLLSHADPIQGSSLTLTQHSRDHHIPMQVKLRSDMRGWRAPVIDKTSQRAPIEQQKSPLADKVQHQAPRTNKDFVERNRSNGDDSVDEPSADTVNSGDNRQHMRVSIKSRHKSNERSHKDKDGDAGPATELQLQNEKETLRDDGTGDLYEVAPGGMTNHQYYSASQVEAEAQKVSAAVKLQMAKTAPLDGDSSSSVVFAVAVAGLVVAGIGIIVAVVALVRQYSEFPEVELESDLPSDLEAGRVEDGKAEATAAVQNATAEEDAAVVDASELSTYIPSDVEEEEETKEGDEDDEDDNNGALEDTGVSV